MEFEWDEAKRLSNIAKHGIDFEHARLLFDGRPTVDAVALSSTEERYRNRGP